MANQAVNPYLPVNEYVPDGEPHVFGNRIYVFGSHDKENGGTFCMLDYVVWSAPVDDLSDWSNTGIVYYAEQDPLYDPQSPNHQVYMYAPDVVQGNDGRFYLYYCMAGTRGKGGYSNPISVAVADRPDGKYQYLGVVRDKAGLPLTRYVCFDPAVMNDAGTIRLYYGTYFEAVDKMPGRASDKIQEKMFDRTKNQIKSARAWTTEDGRVIPEGVMGIIHVELEDDMLTAKTKPVKISPDLFRSSGHSFFEASSIRKVCFLPDGQAMEASQVGGDFESARYYFVYSSKLNHELCYATSMYPDRDFVYGGTLVSNGDVGFQGRKASQRLNHTGNNHGGIEQINGQWYVFYHRETNHSDYMRQGCMEAIAIEEDGSIEQVEITSCGPNPVPLDGGSEKPVTYPAVICCNLTKGRMRHSANGNKTYRAPKITCRPTAKSYAEELEQLALLDTKPVYGNVTSEFDDWLIMGIDKRTGDPEKDQELRLAGHAIERFIGQIVDDTIIGYKYFYFEGGPVTITVRARGKGSGQLYVCTTFDGEAKEVIDLGQSTDWKRYTVSWDQETGVAPLYLCFKGSGEMELLDFTLS